MESLYTCIEEAEFCMASRRISGTNEVVVPDWVLDYLLDCAREIDRVPHNMLNWRHDHPLRDRQSRKPMSSLMGLTSG